MCFDAQKNRFIETIPTTYVWVKKYNQATANFALYSNGTSKD